MKSTATEGFEKWVFILKKTLDENSALLQQLPHWAACSITQALEFLTPAYKGHPRVMAYVLRVLESYPPERVTFFMPQLVQALRYDEEVYYLIKAFIVFIVLGWGAKLVEGYLLRAAQRSDIFAHILIWHLQNSSFQALLPKVKERIIDGFTPKALDLELEKIELEGEDLYLPTATNKLVKGIRVDSGIPLQSAAKVPIMITFNVVDRNGDHNDIKPQACIFKDVLALQVIALLRDIFEAVGLNLCLFPYGVLPTGPERSIIEALGVNLSIIGDLGFILPGPTIHSALHGPSGLSSDGGLYEIFQQDYGPVGSPSFEAALASLLLQPKDRHNGNLPFDNVGRLVLIDFGFILETSPGGNMRFESAHFKLSHEMTQLLDPSGIMKSETWNLFVRGDPIGNLRKRFHPEMLTTSGNLRKRFHPEVSEHAGYDLIQYLQQGIEK
ncbi:Phosphatidylinositol 4-kinase alpha 1 [Fagus crenata]